jgi:hypothetical protein
MPLAETAWRNADPDADGEAHIRHCQGANLSREQMVVGGCLGAWTAGPPANFV